MAKDPNIDAYFERINFSGSIAPTLQTLEALQMLHPTAIPFEGLDPLMGVPVRLELKNLEQKLLFEKRGGYCFEHNLLLQAVLEDLGYGVRAVAARVNWGHADDDIQPLSHMALIVDVNGSDYLVDVGFGSTTLTAPLRLRSGLEQETPHETYQLIDTDPGWRLEVKIGDAFRPIYSFEETEKTFEDFAALNDDLQSDPNFRDNIVASRAGRGRRLALHNTQLRIHITGGETETRILSGLAEIKETLTELFGITLPPAEKLDPAIERVLAAHAAN